MFFHNDGRALVLVQGAILHDDGLKEAHGWTPVTRDAFLFHNHGDGGEIAGKRWRKRIESGIFSFDLFQRVFFQMFLGPDFGSPDHRTMLSGGVMCFSASPRISPSDRIPCWSQYARIS